MKREISILLLCCFAFYHFGFYIFYFSSRYQIEADWNTEIFDGKLGQHKERLIKIPLSVPYMSEQEEFQLANVPFEEMGFQFRVIKQRYVNDTLQVIFVPDLAMEELNHTLKGWMGALIEDFNQQTDSNQPIVKNFIKDYYFPSTFIKFHPPISHHAKKMLFLVDCYQSVSIDLMTPPPELS